MYILCRNLHLSILLVVCIDRDKFNIAYSSNASYGFSNICSWNMLNLSKNLVEVLLTFCVVSWVFQNFKGL